MIAVRAFRDFYIKKWKQGQMIPEIGEGDFLRLFRGVVNFRNPHIIFVERGD